MNGLDDLPELPGRRACLGCCAMLETSLSILRPPSARDASGSALASLESELSAARKAVTDLEAQYAAQVTAIGAAKELLAAKSSLITDLDKLRAAKEGKVAALSPQVETQAAAVAAADRAANPLNHPLVKQFFK